MRRAMRAGYGSASLLGETPDRSLPALAELLANLVAARPERSQLVIDDYHLIAGSIPADELVDPLLTLSPIRLLVTTRARPSWANPRRRLYDEVFELTRTQLAMTDEEAALLLGRGRTGQVELVNAATGWPAALGLAARSTATAAPPEQVTQTLFDYLAEEVLRQEDESVQEFMLRASILPSLDVRAIETVLEIHEPETIMAYMWDKGLLHDIAGRTHFHTLLRSSCKPASPPPIRTSGRPSLRRRLPISDKNDDGTTHTTSLATPGEAATRARFLRRRPMSCFR